MKSLLFVLFNLFSLTLLAQEGVIDSTYGRPGACGYITIADSLKNSMYTRIKMLNQPDGKIIQIGHTHNEKYAVIARLTRNGVPDSTFGNNGIVYQGFSTKEETIRAYSGALLEDGKILIAGSFNNLAMVARFHTDGRLDSTFGINGFVTRPAELNYATRFTALAIQADGKIVATGSTYFGMESNEVYIFRFHPNGVLDESFNTQHNDFTKIKFYDDVKDVAIQKDGKIIIIITGSVVLVPEDFDFLVLRFNTDGNLDPEFGNNGKVNIKFESGQDHPTSIAIQPDGKILIVGYTNHTSFDDDEIAMARLIPNGQLDTAFGNLGKVQTKFGNYQSPRSVLLQADGKFLVSGGYGSYEELKQTGLFLTRYNNNGSIDETFAAKGILRMSQQADEYGFMTFQDDNHVIVGGYALYRTGPPVFGFSSFRVRLKACNLPRPTITGPESEGCNGEKVTLTASGGSNYQWYENCYPIPGATGPTLTVNRNSTRNFRVVTYVDECYIFSGTYTLYGKPLPPKPVIWKQGAANLCPGDSIEVTTSFYDFPGHQWYKNDTAIKDGTGKNYYAKEAGLYTLKIWSTNGCISEFSEPVQIAEATPPATPVLTAGGSTNVCAGTSVSLTSSVADINQWYKDGVLIPNYLSQRYWATEPGTYQVRYKSGGCFSRLSEPVIITHTSVAAPVITADGPTSICTGGSVKLTSSATENNQWSKDGVVISNSSSQTYTVTQPGTYRVRYVSSACTSGLSEPIIVTQASLTPPVITAEGSVNVCAGTPVKLTSSAGNNTHWYKNGVTITNYSSQTYTATEPGTYWARYTPNGCASGLSNTIIITHTSVPTPVITADNNILTSSAATNNQWYLNGAPIAGAVHKQFSAQANGLYTVGVSQNGCNVLSAPFNYVNANNADSSTLKEEVVAYPNPVKDVLSLTNNELRHLNVKVFDRLGKPLLEFTFSSSSATVPIENLAKGTYYLLITDVKTKETISITFIKL